MVNELHRRRGKYSATANRAVMYAEKHITRGNWPMVVITHNHSGSSCCMNSQLVLDVTEIGRPSRQDLINVIRLHGQKITSFHYQKVVRAIYQISNRCVTNVNSVRMRESNLTLKGGGAGGAIVRRLANNDFSEFRRHWPYVATGFSWRRISSAASAVIKQIVPKTMK